ncbi:uncharacterized protein [Zea mays]|nr:uncharacterized protein LOC100502405 isoform X1 [Zea mays]|eukprot:XP_020399396.1 uncharacterized protein LOC100502405 isoform X1 [Zea mays]
MEKESKQGFFSALKGEVVRGLSPGRSRGKSLLLPRSRKTAAAEEVAPPEKLAQYAPDPLVTHSGSLRLAGEVLAPLMEGPDVAEDDTFAEDSGRRDGFGQWVRGHLTRAPLIAGGGDGSFRRSDLRLLLGVMGAPLAPVSVSTAEPLPLAPVKGAPIESSSAQYILQQYLAASGGAKVLRSARNAYAMGKVRMVASEFETATRVVKNRGAAAAAAVEQGGFVLWRMSPDMWYVELAVGGSKVRAGCNGRLVWRHTPWLGAHAAKGPVRPLRRALQVAFPSRARLDACHWLVPTIVCVCVRARVYCAGSGSAVDCGAVRGGAVRGREEGGRRGVLHPEAVGGRGDAAAAERGSGGDHPARGVRVLQPAHGPAGAGGGLAPDAHPAARRRGRRVLGDHHQLVPGGLPRGGRRGDRARGAVRRDAVPVRRDGHEPHQDAHGGGVDHPGGRLRRAGPVHRLLHPAGRRPARLRLRGRALRAPAARRQGRRRAPRVRRGALAAAAGCGPGRWGAGDKIYRTVEMRFLTVGDGTDRADSYRKSSTITSS